MARSDPQLNFRIPEELRDKLAEAAKANNRSMTGELIARLENSFHNPPPETAPQVMQLVDDTARVFDEVGSPEELQRLGAVAVAAVRNAMVASLRPVKFGTPTVSQEPVAGGKPGDSQK